MVTTLCLLGCVLATAQPVLPSGPERPLPPVAAAGEWLLTPHLGDAQELVYRGTFTETSFGNVQFSRAYRLENRVFVLEVTPRGLDVAILTRLLDRPASGIGAFRPPGGVPKRSLGTSGKDELSASSTRLERVLVDAQGRLTAESHASLAVPLEGPPTIECGAFVMVPPGRVGTRGWTVNEAGRPEWRWAVTGTDMVNGSRCLKLVGVQQSDDYEQPRGDRPAWRRQDTVWVAPRDGVAHRVERVIERKQAGRREPTQQSVLSYDLSISPRYPASLVDGYRRDIEKARLFLESARPFLAQPERFGPQLTALLARIDAHLQAASPTPYRAAVLQVRARVEAARRGETPATLPPEVTDPGVSAAVRPVGRMTVGRTAPDFAAPDLTNPGASAGLRGWRGRPILLVFYSPRSPNLDDLMRLVARISAAHKDVAVVALAMTGEGELVRKQSQEKGWKFPILDGTGLRVSYDVKCTPKLVLIDAAGAVRGSVVGWGRETAGEIAAEMPQWLKR